MIEMYFNLVILKKRTCNQDNRAIKQVPETLREDVLLLLKEKGYNSDGNLIQ